MLVQIPLFKESRVIHLGILDMPMLYPRQPYYVGYVTRNEETRAGAGEKPGRKVSNLILLSSLSYLGLK